jgi:hypothetical protein
MNKENVVYIHNGVLCSHKEIWNYVICRKMDEMEIIILNDLSKTQKDKYGMQNLD